MTRNQHDVVNDHFGTLTQAQIATGTPTSGYVPTATGTSTDPPAWAAQTGGGGGGSSQWKDPVRVATTVPGTLSTDFANGQTVDGVTLATGNRILIKDQSTQSANGIYTVNASGSPTRATDWDSGTEAEGAVVYVREGTANGKSAWSTATTGTITIGTTAVTFSHVAGYFIDLGNYYQMRPGITEIRADDNHGGFYSDGSYSQMWSDGTIDLSSNNGTPGGASTNKHYCFGGHGLVLPLLTADPSGANSEEGQMYYNTSTHKFRGYNGTVWQDLN